MALSKITLDDISCRLLHALMKDARTSYAELGRLVGLSAPAVAERIKRLEDAGVVTGYRVLIDHKQLGYELMAFIRLRTSSVHYPHLQKQLSRWPQVLECHHVTGDDALIFKVVCRSLEHLDTFIQQLAPFGETSSSIVLSTFLQRSNPPVLSQEYLP